MSVTALAKRRSFQRELVARRLARLKRSSKQLLLHKWTGAQDLGSDLHAAIDDYLNGKAPKTAGITAEFDFFLAWREQRRDWQAWRSEWRLFCKELRLAGTLDCLFRLPDGSWILCDWKRVEQVTADKVDDWTRQLNLYRYLLLKHYGIVVGRLLVVVLHPKNEGAVEHEIAIDDALVEDLVLKRRRQLEAAESAHERAVIALRDAEEVLAREMTGGSTSITSGSSTDGGSDGGGSSCNSSRGSGGGGDSSSSSDHPRHLSGKSVSFAGRDFPGTSRAELGRLAVAAGLKVKSRRAEVDVVVQGEHFARGVASASAEARGAACLSAPSFVAAASAVAAAQRAAAEASAAQGAAEG
jgi:hypothetical protein